MTAGMLMFGVGSYALASVAYAAITAVLLVNHPGGRRATWITMATGVSALWACTITVLLLMQRDVALDLWVAIDAMHAFVWTACVLVSLTAPGIGIGRGLLTASAGTGVISVVAASSLSASDNGLVYLSLLVMALIGLLAVEQLYRNTSPERRDALRLLCVVIGALFVVELFVFSQATMLGGPVQSAWQARGVISAALAPVLLLAVKRQAEWKHELFVSRQVAFYTASLIGVGAYLLLMSIVAYVLRAIGGEWGLLLQLLFLVSAIAALVFVFFSSSIRARLRVLVVKHFYKNKYDYRLEWLRLTECLGRTSELGPLASNALSAVADIIGSRSGALWVAHDERYDPVALLARKNTAVTFEKTHPIPTFLAARDWVIDSQEYCESPERYGHAFGPPQTSVLPDDALIVPLKCQGDLLGFVVLDKPPEVLKLNFEDHDILRTAGRQAAVVLAQALAQDQLTATRQFEAVNKLSTFLMHDLKNLVAQQELLVANAERFRDRPEFITDMIATVRSGAGRMRKVLDQLQSAGRQETHPSRADASAVIHEVAAQCADRAPHPRIVALRSSLWVLMDRDRLASCVTHLIRNAQDATPADGSVELSLASDGDTVTIIIADTGCGMDNSFIRERLFRPFDSTKGAKGMGIGAYQVREAVHLVGGEMEVESRPGAGTSIRLSLPAAADVQRAAIYTESVA